MANLSQVLLPLLAGTGQGLMALSDEKRRERDDAGREADRRAQRALQQNQIDRDLREQGLRPLSDTDLADAAMRTLKGLPGPSATPAAVSVTAPSVASSPATQGSQSSADRAMLRLSSSNASGGAMRKYAESVNAANASGRPAPQTPADKAMLQLSVQQTFKAPAQPAADADRTSFTQALHPRTIQDVYGNARQYVDDPSITPESRAMRELARRADLERKNTIAVRDAEIATQQNQASIDRDRRRDAYIAAGYTPQQAAVAAENPAMADNVYASTHPRAESPSEVEYRRGLSGERQQRQRDQEAKYIVDAADKFIEAANGEPNLAASFALQDARGRMALGAGMGRADFQAAAQRYKDRFTAKSKSNDDESSFVELLRGGANAGGRGAAPARATEGSAPGGANTATGGKQTISRDQADYIKSTRGWTDAMITARYVVR